MRTAPASAALVAAVLLLASTAGATSLLRGDSGRAVCDFEWMKGPDALTALVKKTSPETDKMGGPQYAVPAPKSQMHSYQNVYYDSLLRLVMDKCTKETPEERTVRVLEIGLGCGMPEGPGGSLRMWRAVLQKPLVLDLHIMEYAEDCGKEFAKDHPELLSAPAVGLHFGNQDSGADLDRIVKESGGKPFDLIVDDGSHVNEHQRFSLQRLFPHVANRGHYVIEDTQSACIDWDVNWGGTDESVAPKGGATRVGGSKDCLHTTDGKPTILATVAEWQKQLSGRGRFPAELPGCESIQSFRTAVVFEKED